MNGKTMVRASALKLTVVSLFAMFVAACGSEGPPGASIGGASGSGSSTAGAAGSTAGTGGGGEGGGAGGDATGGTGSGGHGGSIIFGGSGGGGECVPKTCEELAKDCGPVADGCGAILDCGTCDEGSACGIVTSNVCSVLSDLCVPALAEEVCAGKECGVEGDGCGGTISCGTCAAGEGCGLEQAFQCSPLLTGTDNDCPALITDCAQAGAECGTVGNGCGGTLDCGQCAEGEICGLNAPSLCGTPAECEPATAAEACDGTCGFVSDGCGAVINCTTEGFSCPDGQTCGGGGVRGECGSGATSGCTPLTEEQACAGSGIECGFGPDGCGEAYACGTCAAGESCVVGQCEGAPACTPLTKAVACAGKECGVVSDGCGGTIACDTCPAGETCGLHVAFECGSNTCQPLTKEQACGNKQCGTALDGCEGGSTYTCGTCASGSFCGLNTPFQCGTPEDEPCTDPKQSCAALGWECGIAINSCGETFDCSVEGRSCNAFQTCEGGLDGNPTECTGETPADCTLCADVPTCSVASPTRLTGRVITPGRSDADVNNQIGVPNAFVYILRTNDVGDLPAIETGIPSGGTSCDRCSEQDLGPVLASAITDGTGAFTLSGNIPVGQDFLLVTKVGKFRRAVTHQIPAGSACQTTALPVSMPSNPTRLPRSMTDAPTGLAAAVNIPRVAVSTGRIDAMECVFFKMGVAQSEFGNFGSSARVHLYRGGSSSGSQSGARIDGSTPFDTNLYGSLSRLQSYDMVVADCEGQSYDSSFAQRDSNGAKVREYVNRGGRMFASHLSFSWLHQNGTQAYSSATPIATGLGQAATWSTSIYTDENGTGVISRGRPQASGRIENFVTWMVNEGVTSEPDLEFDVTDPRSLVTALGSSTEEFVFREDGNGRVQQFSFNTPYAAPEEESCGRVTYSGFHVAATGGGTSPFSTATFPTHCTNSLANNGVLTDQEKVLLYMLFDLGACVGDEPLPPECTPDECPADGSCGTLPDGCGGQLECGCDDGEACVSGQCIVPDCVPTTCEAEGVICSSISDGCNQVIECDCPVCIPLTQEEACDGECGTVSDGCSNTLTCPTQCAPGCVPLTACPAGACGVISDGCNGTLTCDNCEAGFVCGGGGQPNVCGVPECERLTCEEANAQCGQTGDGCDGFLDCGACPPGQACVTVGGVPNQCAGCEPRTCEEAGAECGTIGDGCGGTVPCGDCPVGEVCGAQAPNQCGTGVCNAQTCEQAGAECGIIGDGCGGTTDCGDCPAGQLCGVATPFQCGPAPACTPKTCEDLGAECGQVGDGCGAVIDCGVCLSGGICGLARANQCSVIQ